MLRKWVAKGNWQEQPVHAANRFSLIAHVVGAVSRVTQSVTRETKMWYFSLVSLGISGHCHLVISVKSPWPLLFDEFLVTLQWSYLLNLRWSPFAESTARQLWALLCDESMRDAKMKSPSFFILWLHYTYLSFYYFFSHDLINKSTNPAVFIIILVVIV